MSRIVHSLSCISFGLALAIAGSFTISAGTAEAAEDWPGGSVTFVLPTGPGGSADQSLLPLKAPLEKELGTTLLYSYKKGAGGELGWSLVYNDGAKGTTIGGFWIPHMPNTVLFQKPPYKVDDFSPVAMLTGDVPVWFANKNSPYNDMNDLLADARKRPDQVKLVIGVFTGEHYITVASVEQQAKVDFRVVSVQAGSKVTANILGNHFDVGVIRPLSIYSVRDEVKCLGVVAAKRSPVFPNCKTFDEQLSKDVKVPHLSFSIGVLATTAFKKSNPEGFKKLVAAVKKAAASKAYIDGMKRAGRVVTYAGPDEAAKMVKDTAKLMEQYKPMIKKAQGK
jgi:tripartite-type tricarboxylate transporter receptor subunit TctC